MHLTAIRLAGFKSFADNTTFPVDAPLTGIIGNLKAGFIALGRSHNYGFFLLTTNYLYRGIR
ncbi:MAG: hypothetical protein ACFNTM_03480, partial [Cardiobacterium sp.]